MKKYYISIKFKMLIPITLLLVILAIVLVNYLHNSTTKKIENKIKEDSDFIKESIYSDINRISEKATEIASIFASIKSIDVAYQMENEDSGRVFLRKLVAPYIKSIKSNTKENQDFRVHFHKPLAISFLRPWRKVGDEDGGDNLASFRKSIIKASLEQTSVKGIELGKGGIVIRGIVPIFKDKKPIGTVENYFPFSFLEKQTLLNKNQNLAIFIEKKAAEITWELSQNAKVGDFRFASQAKDFSMDSFDENLLKKGINEAFTKVLENEAISVFPLYNFNGEKIGVFYYTLNISDMIKAEHAEDFFLISRLSIVLIFIFLIIFFFSFYSISKPLNNLSSIFEQIAEGKLDHRFEIKQNDEIGQISVAAEEMVKKIKNILLAVKNTSTQLSMASNEISSAAQQVASGSNIQASTSQEITASIDELMQEINRNADNASVTNKISSKSSNDLEQTNRNVLEIVNAMKLINEKIKFVDEIARKTDLLSLNAAVESARAGESGKGFSVVSSEIKKLAQRTQNLANEIIELSHNSVSNATNAGDEISKNLPEIRKTFSLVQEITASSQTQKVSIDNLNSAINEMNKVTQENAASSEELASNSEELAAQAEMLEESIFFFKFDENTTNLLATAKKQKNKDAEKDNDLKNFRLDQDKLNDEDYQEF